MRLSSYIFVYSYFVVTRLEPHANRSDNSTLISLLRLITELFNKNKSNTREPRVNRSHKFVLIPPFYDLSPEF
jgi:hypothetical protein